MTLGAACMSLGCGAASGERAADAPVLVATPERSSPDLATEPEATTATADPVASCGDAGCRHFDTVGDAFQHVLDEEPSIIAIGEAHALAGASGETTAKRFTRDLLPLLSNRASDLVIELLVPDPSCKKKAAEVREQQKVVTKRQSVDNLNDYMALGTAAKHLGVTPHALNPSCADLDEISSSGADGVLKMLEAITRLSLDLTKKLHDRNVEEKSNRSVVLYGGLMHNDVEPRAGREEWSFGPALKKHSGDRYVEVDLIVREAIKDDDTWRALPWYAAFDAEAEPSRATLFTPADGAYVIVFPRSPTKAQPAASD